MNYLLARHNSGGSEVGFRCLLTGIEALIRLVKKKSEVAHCGKFRKLIYSTSTKFHIYTYFSLNSNVIVVSPDDGRLCRPIPVVYVRNKWMLQRLQCCIGWIAKQDVSWTYTMGWWLPIFIAGFAIYTYAHKEEDERDDDDDVLFCFSLLKGSYTLHV
jgi:hypothetical protein